MAEMKYADRSQAIAAARACGLADLVTMDAEVPQLLVVHRSCEGEWREHGDDAGCWCAPLVISVIDPRFEDLTRYFDYPQ
jgi:hypothetical protein